MDEIDTCINDLSFSIGSDSTEDTETNISKRLIGSPKDINQEALSMDSDSGQYSGLFS